MSDLFISQEYINIANTFIERLIANIREAEGKTKNTEARTGHLVTFLTLHHHRYMIMDHYITKPQ